MNFEQALAALREGKKIRHPSFETDEYFMACHVGLVGDDTPFNELPISIVKMKGDRQHESMIGVLNYIAKIKKQLKEILTDEDYKKYHNIYTDLKISEIFDDNLFRFPQLNLGLVMCDDWEIVE